MVCSDGSSKSAAAAGAIKRIRSAVVIKIENYSNFKCITTRGFTVSAGG